MSHTHDISFLKYIYSCFPQIITSDVSCVFTFTLDLLYSEFSAQRFNVLSFDEVTKAKPTLYNDFPFGDPEKAKRTRHFQRLINAVGSRKQKTYSRRGKELFEGDTMLFLQARPFGATGTISIIDGEICVPCRTVEFSSQGSSDFFLSLPFPFQTL